MSSLESRLGHSPGEQPGEQLMDQREENVWCCLGAAYEQPGLGSIIEKSRAA